MLCLLLVVFSKQTFADGKLSIYNSNTITKDELTQMGFVNGEIKAKGLKSVRPSREFIFEVMIKANATSYRLTPKEVIAIANKHGYVEYSNAADGVWGFRNHETLDTFIAEMSREGFKLSAKYLEEEYDKPETVSINYPKSYPRASSDIDIILCKPTNVRYHELNRIFRYLDDHSFDADIEKRYLEQLLKVEADCFGFNSNTAYFTIELKDSKETRTIEVTESQMRFQDHLSDHHGIPNFNLDLNINPDSMVYRHSDVFDTILVNSYQVNEK